MAISLGDIKKKKITVSPIKNTNTNNTTYNVAPPVNNQREKQTYNLGEIKNNNITVTPLSERPKSKVMVPTPQETMTINNINKKINANISKKIVSGGIQNDIHNMNMAQAGKNSLDKNIDLSGKSINGKSTPVTEEGIEQTQNELMSKKELREKKKALEKQIRNYDRKEKVQWWNKGLSLDRNLRNVGYKLFSENQNNKYKEDKEFDKLVKRKNMVEEELNNRFVQEESHDMSSLDKLSYTITGNTEKSLKGIDSTVYKLTGQDVPMQQDSINERLSVEARNQSSGLEGVGLDILGSMSRMLPQMVVGGGTGSEGASLAVGFANYGGDAYNEAKKMGATEEQATKYGLTIGSLEMGLEKLLGGMENVYGKSALGKSTNKIMSKVISNPTFRNILSNSSGEFTEEYLQEFLEPIVRNVILEEDNGADFWNSENLDEGLKRLSSQLFNSQNLYAGTLGAISSASMSGPSSIAQNINTKNEVNNIKKTISNENIEQNITSLMDKGYDIDTSLDIVNQALYQKGISQVDKKSVINNISQNQNTPNLPNNSAVEQRNINNNINNQANENVQNSMPTIENNIQEKYSNVKPPMVIKYQATDNEKINSFRQSAVKEGMIDSKKTTNAMNVIEKVISDKDYNVKFDRTITNLDGKSVDGKININKNGEVEIALNPNSDRAVEFLLTHEITHAIETNELRGIILDYANKNSEFKSALQDLQKTYGTNNVSDEVIADISGQILGNQEFINSLSMQNTEQSRGFISKVYHSIQRLLNKLTTNGRYRNFVQDLETKWRKAYANSTMETAKNNLNSDSKYMMTSINGMNNGINTDNKYMDLKKRYDKAQKLMESGIYSNEYIRQETGWFQDKEDNWEFEISDHKTRFKIKPQPNTQYTMSDLFEATTLYEMYPELKDIKVSFKKMKGKGSYFSLTNNISVNNNLINNIDDARGTLLHEIQHYIQHVENLPEGTTILFGNEQYANSKGEIEAADTKNRRNMTVAQRKQYIPESSKKNPIHPNRENILNHKRGIVEKIGEKVYNVLGDKSSEIAEEIEEKTIKDNNRSSRNGLEELDNSSFSLKEKQLEIIKKNNPVEDDYHTWIRNIDDIKTLSETLEDSDWEGYDEFNPDLTRQDILEAIDKGEIIVYSSYPIEQGTFISPSKIEAESYSGNGKVYSKKVLIDDVAWIDPTQGQYAKVEQSDNSKIVDNKGRTLSKEQQEYFKDSKVRDENGNLLTMYHGTPNGNFTEFNPGSYFSSNENYANNYQDENASILKQNKGVSNKKTYQVYLNITNPFELSNSVARDIYINEFIKGGNSGYFDPYTSYNDYVQQFNNNDGFEWLEAEDLKEWILENHPEFDGLVVQEVPDNVDPDAVNLAYIPFNSNQIKNVDNLNPTENNDIRYSQKSSTWQEHLENNYKATGTRTYFDEITNKKIAPINNNVTTNQSKVKPPIAKEYQKNTIAEKIEKSNDVPDVIKISDKLTRKEVRKQLLDEMNITAEDLSVGDDIKSLNFQLTDPIRVNEKVFGYELGKKVNEATIGKTKHNEAEKTRWLNYEKRDIKELGIKPRSKESAAVQKYGEKQYVNKYGETVEYGDKELMAEFPNVKTQEKIKRASQMIRNKYDKYIDQINETLTALGYDEIPKRPDYMRHFQELGDIFSQTGVPFNLNDMSAEDLPTDINGLTEFNKPGKNWFASAQKRYGNKTTYDAITGIDGYLEGASNLIFHTEDIQRYRALSGLIRDNFGKTKGFENLDNLSNKEALKRIDDIQHNKLSKYVAWLDEQANSLAGKKGAIDRGTERMLGRRGYTILNTIKKQVGSNMTGFNVRSAMTNFISSTIAASKTNKIAMVKGTVSTIRNMFHNDGFINKSDFLTTRFGSDSLSPKLWDKISNAGQILMSGSDYFTSNQIVRSKYYEGLQKGMSENEAIKYADDFGARVMGDRSKGATAEAFNSKTLGFLTQFQLETNNQWQFMVHDTKMDFQRNSKINGGMKAGATVLFQLGQLCAYSYFFNELFQSLTGSRAAFDPIDILMKLFGWGDDDDDKTFEERMKEAGDELVDSIPFAGLFGNGGRMPISDALTPLGTTYDYLTGGKNSYGGDITLDDVKNDFVSTLPYYFLPTGYSQIKKTKKGLSMFSDNKEIKGSYSKSGRLRFPIKDTVGNRIKSGLFGEYASKEASEYFEQGRAPLTDKQQNMYKTLDVPISEYWTIKNDISNLKKELKGKKTEERQETIYKYIDDLDISQVRKDILKKSQYKSYKSADDKIIKYINSSKMSKKSKNEILKELKLDK